MPLKINNPSAGDYRKTRSVFLKLIAMVVLAHLLASAGCVSRPPITLRVLPDTEAERLLSSVAEHYDRYRSVNGLARLRGEIGGQSFSFSQGILAVGPDKLRLETLGPFGQPVVSIATDGQIAEAMIPGRKQFWRGAAGSPEVNEFLRLPMNFRDLVGLLLYRVPIQFSSDRNLVFDSTGQYRLTLSGPNGRRQVLYFDFKSRLTESAWFAGEELQARVEYSEFQDETGFPRRFFWEIPDRKQEVSVVFSELSINPEISADRFRIEPLPGMKVLPFPEQGGAGPFDAGG